MNSLAHLLTDSRFYGAKSEPIDAVDVVRTAPFAGSEWQVVSVTHGSTTDLYQLLIDAGHDVLSTSPAAVGQALRAGDVPGTLHGSAQVKGDGHALGGEQSNTSLIFDDRIVKFFRRLEPGLSPDVELLSAIDQCPHIAPVRGWITTEIDGQDYTLAMIQDLVKGGQDGFELALNYARADRSFEALARDFGQAIASVHKYLAKAFPTETRSNADIAATLRAHAHDLRSPALDDYRGAADNVYEQLPASISTVQRIHGDLHLGQALHTDTWILIDFEGEPARPLQQRRLPDSPMRDVAGVLRSLDYAAHIANASEQWTRDAQAAVIDGYGEVNRDLLRAYTLDKALYEVEYEANNRPDWVNIPLDAVNRLLSL